MTAMADDGVSVLLSSHALADLDRVADYLVVLSGGEPRLAGETDDLLACHRVLTGPVTEADAYAGQFHVVQDRRAGAQAHLLVRTPEPGPWPARPGWEAHQVGLEELVLAYLSAPGPAARPLVLHTEPTEVGSPGASTGPR
jgi:ABC-2 type transport system ATP-binding protein